MFSVLGLLNLYIRRDIHEKMRTGEAACVGAVRPMMPILFWLPLIYITALFEIAVSPTKNAPGAIGFE
jgi:hypothetical protein